MVLAFPSGGGHAGAPAVVPVTGSGVPGRGWAWCPSSGKGGSEPAEASGDVVGPAPVLVDPQVELAAAADELGGDVQYPVAERRDLAARQGRVGGEADQLGPADQVGRRLSLTGSDDCEGAVAQRPEIVCRRKSKIDLQAVVQQEGSVGRRTTL